MQIPGVPSLSKLAAIKLEDLLHAQVLPGVTLLMMICKKVLDLLDAPCIAIDQSMPCHLCNNLQGLTGRNKRGTGYPTDIDTLYTGVGFMESPGSSSVLPMKV